MATKNTAEAKAPEATAAAAIDLKTIEAWAKEKGTDNAVLGGVKAMMHWNSGKSVSEEEYVQAVEKFEKGPTRRGFK